MADQDQKPILSRPKERTLEAFKSWIIEFTKSLNPDAKTEYPDDRWAELHQKFWQGVDNANK